MAVVMITPVEVESELKERGYFVSDGHTPQVPIIHHGVHDIPPVPVVDDGVHDVPPVPTVHDGVHDVPPVPDIHSVHALWDPKTTPVPDINSGLDVLPDVHIPLIQEGSKYAKYIRFLPLLMMLLPEKEVLDLGRVL